MKRTLTLLLSLAMVVALLGGCGNGGASSSGSASGSGSGSGSAASGSQAPSGDDIVSQLYDSVDQALSAQLGQVPTASGEEKFGAVIISLTNPFWVTMKDCYEAAAQELGVSIDVQTGTTEGDTQSQLDVLMTMADMDYDVILVSPIDGTNLIPGIVKCNENGVKVINLGPGVDTDALAEAGGHLDGKITVNFKEQGQTVANDIIARLPSGGEVAILQGLTGAGQSEGRTAGAAEVLEAAEGIDLVASVPCDWDATKAYDATKDILTEHPDLKAIFACNDVMALAAVEALGAEGRSDVLVYGVDFTDDARAAMKEGTMTGSMSYSSVKYTEAALKMAIAMAQGTEYADPIYLPLTLVSVDNVSQMDDWK
ncbi:substrate-binding domain-containing protein [Oscillibacter hominis]|uniref:Substrate-binding domain-containing protein n=1 Tax=Oscillibacter hominis TaxID=2763056 RepID=A0A7G9B542_9FIRM|nr:substrate-binding domain-containing protein [Oscillibacter hominis]QNL44673.1 substrate-binding domain-containing protein [Oscillibacter hominis]